MKKIFFTLLTATISLISYAQAPKEISYQGVARNVSGTILSNQNIGIKLDLHQGSAGGTVVFSEAHNKNTNNFGLFTLGIGSINTSGFSAINWAGGPYFLEVSIDVSGGTTYISVGTQQFMSVPYALYAETSGNASSNPTITINAPNTISSAAGSYTINIPSSATYTAGNGIDITGGIITSTANIVGAGSTTVSGTYPNLTISSPASQIYTAGNGIDITSGVISNTATAITPTIIGSGATTVLSSGNTFTVNTPASQVYTAGNGIDITGGIISNTATAITPTITATGIAVVTPTTGNVFNIDVPAPTLLYNNTTNELTITQGSAVSTQTLNGTGSNTISIVGDGLATVTPLTGSTFTVSVPNPTLSVGGGSISISNGNSVALPISTTYTNGSGISITSGSVITNTLPDQTVTINGTGATTVTGTYPSFTITSPTIAAAVTQTITGTGVATVNNASPNYTVDVPMSTYNNANGVFTTGTQTISVAPDLTLVGNVLRSGPASNTVAIPTSSTTTIAQGTNILVAGSAPNYTVSAPAYSISLPGGNTVQITNGVSTSTAPIAATNLTLNGANNNILSAGGNTVGLNTYTAGTGITISGTAPNYTLSSPNQSLTINSNSLSITGGNTVTIPTASIVSTNTNISVTSSAGVFSLTAVPSNLSGDVIGAVNSTTVTQLQTRPVSNTAPTANQVLTWNGSAWTPSTTVVPILSYTGSATAGTLQSGAQTVTIPNYTLTNNTNTITLNNGAATSSVVIPVPVLALTGTTLQSGPSTNTVSLASLNGIYGGSGSIQTGSTTVTVGTNTLTFLSGTTAGKSIANFFGGGITGTHLAVGHIGVNAAAVKLFGSVATTPVDYGYISGSSNGIAISGGTSSNGLYVTNTAEVGVGTFTTGIGKFVITHSASQTNPTMHLREATSGLNRIKFSNNTVPNKFFETAAQTNATDANGAYSINYFDGTTYKPVMLVTGERKVNINNLNTVLASLHVMENATTAGGGIVSEGFGEEGQINIVRNNQAGIGARVAVSASEILGRINFSGYNGATFNPGAEIYGMSTESQTGSAGGTELNFRVTPTGTIASQDIFKLGSDGTVSVNPNNSFSKTLLDVKGRLKVDSSLTMGAYNIAPSTSFINEGRIYYDRPTNKFKVSENGGAYVDLIPGAVTTPWSQSGLNIYTTLSTDRVGIGTNLPSSKLQVENILAGDRALYLYQAPSTTNEALFIDNRGSQQAAIIETNNSSNSNVALLATSNGIGGAIRAQITNTLNAAEALSVMQDGQGNALNISINNSSSNARAIDAVTVGNGEAGHFIINNTSNTSSVLYAKTNGQGPVFTVEQTGTGRGIDARIFGGTNTVATIFAQTAGLGAAGFFEVVNTSSNSNAVSAHHYGVGATIVGNNYGNGSAGSFAITNATNTANALQVSTNGSGNAINASALSGRALSASSSGSTNPTANFTNSNSGDVIMSFAGTGRAIYAQSGANGMATSELTNTGTGPVVFAYKNSGTTGGVVANFANNSNTNSADAVFSKTEGSGAALHAVSSATNNSSALALLVENGHIATSGAQPSIAVSTASLTAFSLSGNSTDVAGVINFSNFSGGTIPAGSVIVTITFSKPYSATPVVILTAANLQAGGDAVYVSGVTTAGFELRYNSNMAIGGRVFNYMVIETK